jgi:hypothetical protein
VIIENWTGVFNSSSTGGIAIRKSSSVGGDVLNNSTLVRSIADWIPLLMKVMLFYK